MSLKPLLLTLLLAPLAVAQTPAKVGPARHAAVCSAGAAAVNPQ